MTGTYALIDRTGYVVMHVGTLGEVWRHSIGCGNVAIARLTPTCWFVIARRPSNWDWITG